MLKKVNRFDIFVDLIIKYECIDNIGEIKCHRLVVSNLEFFNGLFKHAKLDVIVLEEKFYYVTNMKVPFCEKSFLSIIDMIYGEKKCNDIDLIDALEILDIIECLYYLQASDEMIFEYYDDFTDKLLEEKNYSKQKKMFIKFCDLLGINNYIKSAFIARFYYILNDEDKATFKYENEKIFPENYFIEYPDKNYSIFDDKNIIISSNHSQHIIDYGNLQFEISKTYFKDDYEESHGFWILCKYCNSDRNVSVRAKINLKVYDGLTIYNIRIKNRQDHKNDVVNLLEKNGDIIYKKIGGNDAYEFVIQNIEIILL